MAYIINFLYFGLSQLSDNLKPTSNDFHIHNSCTSFTRTINTSC